MSIVTRFAPSPTGYLHVGNIRTALINWLFARASGGKFILRIDDTDKERSKQIYTDAIFRDLEWLGLNWDEVYYQSERMDLYESAKNKLIECARLYPCFETSEELIVKKKTQLARNLPPIYDRAALKLDKSKIEGLQSTHPAHWRFFINHDRIEWDDGIKQVTTFEGKNISDPVLIRTDGSMTYMIASVVDDIDLKITDIIRGEDHITNSAIQIQLFEALKSQSPKLSHLALLAAKDAEISKRIGGFDIATLRESGIHPMTINSFLMKIGTSEPIEPRYALKQLVTELNLKNFNKSPTNYHLNELQRLNEKVIHNLDYSDIKNFVDIDFDETFWLKVRPNLRSINDVKIWWAICCEILKPIITDLDFTVKAAELLPEGEFRENTWDIWIAKIVEETSRKGRNLYGPLRLALTGLEEGPELRNMLMILKRDVAIKRLKGEKA